MNTKLNAWEEYALGQNACQLLKFFSSKIEQFSYNFNKLKTKILTASFSKLGKLTILPLKLQVQKDLNKY